MSSLLISRIWHFGVILLLGLGAYLLYGDSLHFDYVWDDTLLFVDKISLLNDPLSWGLLVEPVLPGTSYMRPLVFLTFYGEFSFFGQSPFISHLINILFYLSNSILVYLVANQIYRRINLSRRQASAAVAASIYLVHPALIESTAWVSGRFDLMSTFFILLAVLVYVSVRSDSWVKACVISIAMLLSLLSKELGIVVPAVIFFTWMAIYDNPSQGVGSRLAAFIKENQRLLAFLVVSVGVYFAVRITSMESVYHTGFNIEKLLHSYFVEFKPFVALFFYLAKSFIPFFDMGAFHPLQPADYTSASFWLKVLISFITVGFMLWGAVKKASTVSWMAFAALICVAPVLHIIPLTIGENIGHERFLTAPLAFLVIAVCVPNYKAYLKEIGVRARLAGGLVGLVLVFWLGTATVVHNGLMGIWKSDFTLWRSAYEKFPEFPAARYNYLYGAIRENRIDLAMEVLTKYKDEHGGLEPADQALYADILVRLGDEESLKYMEGLIYVLPKFHKMDNGREFVDNFILTAKHMGGLYSSYSSALVIFDGELQRALDYNEIADWYLRHGEGVMLVYQKAAIAYLMGDAERAVDLLESVKKLEYSGKDGMKRFFDTLVNKYCQLGSNSSVACDQWNSEAWWAKIRAG